MEGKLSCFEMLGKLCGRNASSGLHALGVARTGWVILAATESTCEVTGQTGGSFRFLVGLENLMSWSFVEEVSASATASQSSNTSFSSSSSSSLWFVSSSSGSLMLLELHPTLLPLLIGRPLLEVWGLGHWDGESESLMSWRKTDSLLWSLSSLFFNLVFFTWGNSGFGGGDVAVRDPLALESLFTWESHCSRRASNLHCFSFAVRFTRFFLAMSRGIEAGAEAMAS
jgi:hypothetical protein